MFSRLASTARVAKSIPSVLLRSQSTMTAGATARTAVPAVAMATAAGAAYAYYQYEAHAESKEEALLESIATRLSKIEAALDDKEDGPSPPPAPFWGSSSPGFFDYTGKRCVVTGGGDGIGFEMVSLFAQQGAEVFILDINAENAKQKAEVLSGQGFKVHGIQCDVGSQASVEAAFAEIAKGGRVDVLCNNAGIGHVGNIIGTEVADMDRVMKVNVNGVFLCSKSAIKLMIADGKGGAILNTGSIASLRPIKDRIAYATSKGAVNTLTMALATDHLGDGIRVNSVNPGRIHTNFVDMFIAKNYPGEEEKYFKMLSEYMPNGRMGKPREIAFAALYLCSDEARFVTGEAFSIDGGVGGADHPKLYNNEATVHPATLSVL